MVLLVAIDANVADPGVWQQPQEALDHPETGAQDGNDRHLVAQPEARRGLERSLDLDLPDRQLPRDLDGHDRRGLEQGLAELAVGRLPVAQHRESVGEHGVLDQSQEFGHSAIVSRTRWHV